MTRERLKRLKALLKEAEHLEEEIKSMPFTAGGYVGDSAKDYRTGFPRTITIQGYSTERYDKLKAKLQRKLRDIQGEITELEEWLGGVEDPELRDILRLQYVNGLTQEQIAEKLGYTRAAIAMKAKRFWDGKSVTDCYK